MFKIIPSRISVFFLGFICLASHAFSNDQNVVNDGWHFLVAPYGWLPSIRGDISVKGNTEQVAISFDDILRHFQFGAEGHVEGGYGPATLMIDPTYLKLSEDLHRPVAGGLLTANATLTSKTTLVDGGLFLRVFSSAAKDLSIELLGGGRYLDQGSDLDFHNLPEFSSSANSDFLVPIFGGRIKYDPIPRTLLWLRGDVGGFNMDHVDLTWSISAGASYALYRHLQIAAAYRSLGINYAKNDSAANITINGPMLGIAFNS
jgi:hypothetical protein